jgi:hypothetical protein
VVTTVNLYLASGTPKFELADMIETTLAPFALGRRVLRIPLTELCEWDVVDGQLKVAVRGREPAFMRIYWSAKEVRLVQQLIEKARND